MLYRNSAPWLKGVWFWSFRNLRASFDNRHPNPKDRKHSGSTQTPSDCSPTYERRLRSPGICVIA